MSDFSFDLSGVLGTEEIVKTASNTTNKKAGSDMVMDDFLKLMVAQFQNQSIDDTADTTEMMNQMVQMSVIQAITNLSTLVSDSTNLSYAASLVGKEVTIGERKGSEIEELLGTVTGTGTLNGKQVIFLDNGDTPYNLTDIMAVGRLPDKGNTKSAAAPEIAPVATQPEPKAEQLAQPEQKPEQNVQPVQPETKAEQTQPVYTDPRVVAYEPEPEVVSEPEAVTEPEIVSEPEAVSEPEPVSEPEAIAEPEPVSEPETAEQDPQVILEALSEEA